MHPPWHQRIKEASQIECLTNKQWYQENILDTQRELNNTNFEIKTFFITIQILLLFFYKFTFCIVGYVDFCSPADWNIFHTCHIQMASPQCEYEDVHSRDLCEKMPFHIGYMQKASPQNERENAYSSDFSQHMFFHIGCMRKASLQNEHEDV